MRTVSLPDGTFLPALGQGTWNIGETHSSRSQEIDALQAGIDLGMTLVDTAEMYADGESERVVGEAIRNRRNAVFLVSKAYPQNASRARLRRACEGSLDRLGIDHLDLYLLHWRGAVPLAETVEAMERLVDAGKIRYWGVSNLDTEDMKELVDAGGRNCATDQILYNLSRRGPELELLPWLTERQIPVMAYSPVEQGRLLGDATLCEIARGKQASPAQIALAWLLRDPNVIAIPKASRRDHVQQNCQAGEIQLTESETVELEAAFPRPLHPVPLQML